MCILLWELTLSYTFRWIAILDNDSQITLPCFLCASIVWSTPWSSGELASCYCQPEELGVWQMGRVTGMFMGREQVLEWVVVGTGSCWMASSASWRASTAFAVAIARIGSSGWGFPFSWDWSWFWSGNAKNLISIRSWGNTTVCKKKKIKTHS